VPPQRRDGPASGAGEVVASLEANDAPPTCMSRLAGLFSRTPTRHAGKQSQFADKTPATSDRKARGPTEADPLYPVSPERKGTRPTAQTDSGRSRTPTEAERSR
jgi:hypothetical protein